MSLPAAERASAALAELQAEIESAGATRSVAAELRARELEAQLQDARDALELSRDVMEEQAAELGRASLQHEELVAEGKAALEALEGDLWHATAAVSEAVRRAEAADASRAEAEEALDAVREDASNYIPEAARSLAAVGTCPLLALPHEAMRTVLSMLDATSANNLAASGRGSYVRLASALAVEALPTPHLVPANLAARRSGAEARGGGRTGSLAGAAPGSKVAGALAAAGAGKDAGSDGQADNDGGDDDDAIGMAAARGGARGPPGQPSGRRSTSGSAQRFGFAADDSAAGPDDDGADAEAVPSGDGGKASDAGPPSAAHGSPPASEALEGEAVPRAAGARNLRDRSDAPVGGAGASADCKATLETSAQRMAAATPHVRLLHQRRRAAQWSLRVLFPPAPADAAVAATGPGADALFGTPRPVRSSDVGGGGRTGSDVASDAASGSDRGAPRRPPGPSALDRGLSAIAAAAVTSGLLSGIGDGGSVYFSGGMSIGSAAEFDSPLTSSAAAAAAAARRGGGGSSVTSSVTNGQPTRTASSRGFLGWRGSPAPATPPAASRRGGGGGGQTAGGTPTGSGISAAQAKEVMMHAQRMKAANKALSARARAAKAEVEEVRRELRVAEQVKSLLDKRVTETEHKAANTERAMQSVMEQHEKDLSVIAMLARRADKAQAQAEAAAAAMLEANERAEAEAEAAAESGTSSAAAAAERNALRARMEEISRQMDQALDKARKAEKRAAVAEEEMLRYQRRDAERSQAAPAPAPVPAPAASAPGNPFAAAAPAEGRSASKPGNPFAAAPPAEAGEGEAARLRAEVRRLTDALGAAEERASTAEAQAAEHKRSVRKLIKIVKAERGTA